MVCVLLVCLFLGVLKIFCVDVNLKAIKRLEYVFCGPGPCVVETIVIVAAQQSPQVDRPAPGSNRRRRVAHQKIQAGRNDTRDKDVGDKAHRTGRQVRVTENPRQGPTDSFGYFVIHVLRF